jgi:hypothetical protein|tara:strand:+ start:221 stop:514 length:294 start_codon:yes stop_codon:yes gene_type:complete
MEPEFEFGPFSIGIYVALIFITALIPFISSKYLFLYILCLAILGFVVGMFLVKKDLYNFWNNVGAVLQTVWDWNYLEKPASKVDRAVELGKDRKSIW